MASNYYVTHFRERVVLVEDYLAYRPLCRERKSSQVMTTTEDWARVDCKRCHEKHAKREQALKDVRAEV